jgi:homogentisate 1,2-dioxygenase
MSGPETLYLRNGLGQLAARLHKLGTRRVLVLAAPSRRYVDEITHSLEAFSPEVFDGARVHVPAEVVEAASAKLTQCGADTVVAIGGGSVIGLGKALRLAHDVRFVAVPATYAGSELTTMYGITTGRDKKTGRDDRVRPDLVIYDVSMTQDLPMTLTVQSLMNALAHVVSVLSTGSLDEGATKDALAGAATVLRAIEDLLVAPRDLGAREHALRGAAACALAFERGKPGAQHALAHLLGGATRIEHAPLHAVLLPHFIAHLRTANPDVVAKLERAVDRADLDAYLHDLLVRAGAPVSLDALGASEEAVREALATKPELPAAIANDAQHGLRPPGRGGRIDLGSEPWALLAGPRPEVGSTTVLVLHGRGAEPGTIVRRMREIFGHDPHMSFVGLRAEAGAERWYAVRYSEAGAGRDPEVLQAIERVERALDALPPTPVLAGFSQGACLALEVAARTKRFLAAVFAPAGARLGLPSEWAPPVTIRPEHPDVPALQGTGVLVGAAENDKWIARSDIDATIEWFRGAQAQIVDVSGPGDRHEITLRQRLNARALHARSWPPEQAGFGNTFTSEAIADAVPAQQNSPRVPPHGLYAEQINGTGFTAPRAENQRTWLYRVRPSSQRRAYTPLEQPLIVSTFDGAPEINLLGTAPLPVPDDARDFVDGLVTMCGAGSAASRKGYAFHLYAANRSMEHRAFYNADGDLLILPYDGVLTVMTELGPLLVKPGHVAIIPRGIVFSVLLHGSHARGYVAESFGKHFRLPDRGPIGANGLADARHFRAPAAWYEDRLDPDFRVVGKLGGALHEARQDHSPFDVAGWYGNYVPYVYDLDLFSPSGNVRWDHGDPSVHTVLSSPLDEPGTHALDLVTFPPRWDVSTNTFRPPFFHRNTTSEINGIIREASPPDSPWQPGVAFITPSMTPHGVSGRGVERIRQMTDAEADKPMSLGGPTALWFQFESALAPVMTPWAREHALPDWAATWGSHRSYFS